VAAADVRSGLNYGRIVRNSFAIWYSRIEQKFWRLKQQTERGKENERERAGEKGERGKKGGWQME